MTCTASDSRRIGQACRPEQACEFRQPHGKRTVAMPELRKLVPAYGPIGRKPQPKVRLNGFAGKERLYDFAVIQSYRSIESIADDRVRPDPQRFVNRRSNIVG